jgi:hypothetical protein
MPTFKRQVSGRGSRGAEDMKAAMESVLVVKMNDTKAASRFNLPKSSLQDRIPKIRKGSEVQIPPKSRNICANNINNLDNKLMPLTRQEFGV